MQKLLIIVLVITAPIIACAQAVKTSLPYFNITQVGLLQGQNQHTYSLQTINGISYKKYSAGVGIAYDKYGYKSVPVFADIRYSLLKSKKSALQLYADAGANFPIHSDLLPATKPNGIRWYTLHSSFYGEAGFSYSVALKRRFSFIAGVGYNYKTFRYSDTEYSGDVNMPDNIIEYTYRYSKYVVRVGFGF